MQRGNAVQIKDYNPCLGEICDSSPRGVLCSNCHYDKCDRWENIYPGVIGKNPKRDSSLFLRDWRRCGFKLLWKKESGLRLSCWNNKKIWFLCHRCEDNSCRDYKPTDFYLAVTESDSPF